MIAGESAVVARFGFIWEWEWQLPLLGYLIVGSLQFELLAALLTFADHVWYPHYLQVAGATAASALADQHLAGALMLYPGAIVFVVAAVLTIGTTDSGR